MKPLLAKHMFEEDVMCARSNIKTPIIHTQIDGL